MKQIQIIKNFINEELTGWKTWEISWLIACCIVIAAVSLNLKDTWMGITAAVTGNIYVICTGKGKRCAFLFGTVNVILYALISWEAKFYGEVMLNALYYLPMQFWGFYIWNKNLSNTTHEVHKKRMTGKLRALYASAIILASILYGLILKLIGGSLPFADAFTTAASVAALLMSVKMYMEQWIVWIAVDVLTIIMWGIACASGGASAATLIMWICYLLNGIIMFIKWERESRENNPESQHGKVTQHGRL